MTPEPQQVAIVTGAGGGIGGACVQLFAERGWKVAALDTPISKFGDLGSVSRGVVEFYECDVGRRDKCKQTLASVRNDFGRVDAVVNGAGIVAPNSSHLVTEDEWERILRVHLLGSVNIATASLPYLVESGSGSVVNISSVCASLGFPARLSYNAAKAAVEAATRTLATEWGPAGIRVNAVSPGFIATEQALGLYAAGVADASERAGKTALGRLGEPLEVAEAVYWLSSCRSSYVSGHVLVVDGGFLANGSTGDDPMVPDRDELRALAYPDGIDGVLP